MYVKTRKKFFMYLQINSELKKKKREWRFKVKDLNVKCKQKDPAAL